MGTAQLVIYEYNANVHDYEYAVYCRSCVISSLLDSLGFGIKFPVSHEAGENWRYVEDPSQIYVWSPSQIFVLARVI